MKERKDIYSDKGQISRLEVEQFLADELSDARKDIILAKCKNNPQFQDWIEAQKKLTNPVSLERIKEKIKNHDLLEEESLASKHNSIQNSSIAEDLRGFREYIRCVFSQPAFGIAAAACIVLFAVGLWMNNSKSDYQPQVYASKGTADFLLQFKGEKLTGDKLSAAPGDTLSFVYRTVENFHIQIWYRDDGGELVTYIEKSGASIPLNGVTSWVAYPQIVILDSSWQKEELFIITSENPFSSQEAVEALKGGRTRKDITIKTYIISNSNP